MRLHFYRPFPYLSARKETVLGLLKWWICVVDFLESQPLPSTPPALSSTPANRSTANNHNHKFTANINCLPVLISDCVIQRCSTANNLSTYRLALQSEVIIIPQKYASIMALHPMFPSPGPRDMRSSPFGRNEARDYRVYTVYPHGS